MRLSKANKYSIHTARLMTREGHLLSWETKRSVWAANAVFAVWIPSKSVWKLSQKQSPYTASQFKKADYAAST